MIQALKNYAVAVLALAVIIAATAGAVYAQTTNSINAGSGSGTANSTGTPQCMYFFYANGCDACGIAKAYVLNVEQNYTELSVHSLEIHNNTNFDLMVQYYNENNISIYEYPVIFVGSHVLVGDNAIETQLEPLLANDSGAGCPYVGVGVGGNTTINGASLPPVAFIIGMAAADSLNACAIAVLLILIALAAATTGIWKTGVAYIAGNFVAYLLVGIGLFQVLQQFSLPLYTKEVLGAVTIALAVVTLYAKLPAQSKPIINNLLHSATSPAFAFLAGAAISAIELPCTGGPYFATLTLIDTYNMPQSAILGYLLLYNTIFVMPLVAVLLIYHFADTPSIPKKYIRWASAVLMFIMGVALLLLSFGIL